MHLRPSATPFVFTDSSAPAQRTRGWSLPPPLCFNIPPTDLWHRGNNAFAPPVPGHYGRELS